MSFTPEPETDYLQPDFDPNSLTIPKLRGILVAHEITYPSAAKKGQLVDIFEQEITPQAKRILSARSKTKRSTRGIVDVASSAEASVDGDASDDDRRPTRTPRRRTTRTGTEETSPERGSVARSSRASSSRLSHVSDAGSDSTIRKPPASARRTRKSLSTPSVKEESEDEMRWQQEAEESAFSTENVFQSGSSPTPESASASDARRRRTTGGIPASEKRKSSSSRRKTDMPIEDFEQNGRIASPSKRARAIASQTPSRRVAAKEEESDSDAGEEFTPEETEDLALARQEGTVTQPSRRNQRSSGSSILRIAPVGILLAMAGGLGTLWRQEKLAVGFCGIGQPSPVIAGLEIPDWARDAVQPQCEPCPPHAYCYADLQASCEDDFILVPHPLSLGGLFPLPPTCEADGEKVRKVKAVADRAIEELRLINAQFECGELRDETGKKADSPEIKEESLKARVSSKRRRGMSQDEFEDLWHSAIGELGDRDEIVSKTDSTGSTHSRTLRSTSLARIPLACAVRRSLRLALARHLGKLVTVVALFLASVYGYVSFHSGREMETRAKQLAGFALDRLAQQAAWAYTYADDDEQDADAYIGVAQLRDDVLRDEFSASRRKKLWERVQRKVEENANVRSMVREDARSGEVGRVWQWIGAVGALTDKDASGGKNRRKSNRVSFGPILGASSRSGTPIGNDRGQEMREVHQWDEGRPIY